nr:hypothetical protein [Tanacetum cinerariifolium]
MLPEMLEDPYVEVALQAPPSLDYIPGPEEPEQAPLSPDYVPGLEHADDEIFTEDQPYAEDASPITQSPEYVPESNFEAHPEDDDDEDPEEDPVDYPADGGDDDDDEEESSEDDDMDAEADEEEEHPAPADSVVVAPTAADQAPSAEETEPFETDESTAIPPPHPTYRTTARISIPAPVPMPAWTDLETADCRRQTVILELLRIDHRRSTEISELRTALRGQKPMAPRRTTRSTADQETVNATTAPKELPFFLNGVKEWSLSFTSATALLKTKSSLLHALFTLMFFEEADKIEKYVGGLPDMIHGSVVASKPKTMQEAIEIATELMDKKIRTFADREIASKRKFENTS